MALFDRNLVRRVALVIVLKGVFISCMAQTEPSNVCNSDETLACRYDCPPESIQEHCTSGKEKDGYCCPGHFRTNKSTCQVCPEAHVMPDVNNCGCSCLLCAECPRNDTIKTRCSITTDTVCYGTEDQTPRAHAACPWIESTSTPTTQVPTTHVPTTHGPTTDTEEVTVNTPIDPQKSERTSLEKGFLVIVGPFIFLLVVFLLIGFCLCYAYPSDQPDGRDKTWKEVASIVAVRIQKTLCGRCQCGGRTRDSNGSGEQDPMN